MEVKKTGTTIAYYCDCPTGGHLTGCIFYERMRLKYDESEDGSFKRSKLTEEEVDEEMMKRFGKLGG